MNPPTVIATNERPQNDSHNTNKRRRVEEAEEDMWRTYRGEDRVCVVSWKAAVVGLLLLAIMRR